MKRNTRRTRRFRFLTRKGGGVGSSKPAKAAKPALPTPPPSPPSPPPPPPKRVIVFDIDETLLCRREIMGQLSLHWMRVSAGLAAKNDSHMATINDISPRPDFFFPEPMFVYLRPHVKEALAYAKTHADAVYAFSASSNPAHILRVTGLADYFDGIFGREFTTPHFSRADSMYILRKNLGALRAHLRLADRDHLYMLDDRPEWIDVNPGASDHVVAITPFQPAYKLYGVQVVKYPHQADPSDTIPDDTALIDSLQTIFSA